MPGSTIANQLLRPQNSWKGWSDVSSGSLMTHQISATLDSGSTLYTVISAFAGVTPAPTISHPFETGDIVYSVVSGSNPDIRYVINVSSTQFRLASSLSNATAGTALTLGDVTITTDPTTNFTNVNTSSLYAKFALNLFSASAKSTQAFNINVPVRIDWNTAGNTHYTQNNGIVAGLWINATTYYMMTTNILSYFLYSGAILGNGSGVSYGGSYDVSYKGRIIITSSRTIEFWMARNIANPTYTLVYTQSALTTNTPPLYFVAGFCLKNQRIENCTITYL
jgi:hypothetical protein